MARVETKLIVKIDGKKFVRAVHESPITDQRSGEQHLNVVNEMLAKATDQTRRTLSI